MKGWEVTDVGRDTAFAADSTYGGGKGRVSSEEFSSRQFPPCQAKGKVISFWRKCARGQREGGGLPVLLKGGPGSSRLYHKTDSFFVYT